MDSHINHAGELATAEATGQMCEEEERPQNTTSAIQRGLPPDREEIAPERCNEEPEEQGQHPERDE